MFVPYYDEFFIYLTKDDIVKFIESEFQKNENLEKEVLYETCLMKFGFNYEYLILEVLEKI